MIYFRYRWGCLSIRVSPDVTIDINDAVRGEEVFSQSVGFGLDGDMEHDEVLTWFTKAGFEYGEGTN
jgi:hypothetical protein